MERLTIRNSDGSVSQPTDLKWAEALERLAAYEDTGLTPKQVSLSAASVIMAACDKGDLVKALRICVDAEKTCEDCPYMVKCLRDRTGRLVAFLDAANAIEELSAQIPHWIPVTERLPEYGRSVLLYFNRNNHNSMGVGDYYHDGDTLIWRGCGFIPTHWMPMPEPPKEGEIC